MAHSRAEKRLRKIAAYLLCILIVLTLGFFSIHPTLIYISDWLGPLFGSSLFYSLSFFYLLLGNPFRFATLLAIWGGSAFIGGVLIRRRLGAVLMVFLVMVTVLVLMGINLIDVGFTVSQVFEDVQISNPLDVLPPLPDGLTITEIYQAPIIGDIAERILKTFQGGVPENPLSIVMEIATGLILGVLIKMVVMIGSALVGVEVGRLIEPSLEPFSESIRVSLGGKPRGMGNITTIKEALTLCIFVIILVPSIFTTPTAIGESGAEFYLETIFGYAESNNNAYFSSLFASGETQFSDLTESDDLVASVIISHEGITEMLMEFFESEENLGPLTSLLPETLMVAIYVDIPPEIAASKSEDVANAFSKAYKIDLNQVMAFNAPFSIGEELNGPAISLVVYQSSMEFAGIASTYLEEFMEMEGLVDIVSEATQNGRLVPESSVDSTDGAALISGFVNMRLLNEFAPPDFLHQASEYFPVEDWTNLGFSGNFAFWKQGLMTKGNEHYFDVLSLLGAEDAPEFSPDSMNSLVVLVAPNGTDLGGENIPNIKISTNIPEDDKKLEALYQFLQMLGLESYVVPELILDKSTFELGVSGVILPLNIEVTKTSTTSSLKPKSVIDVTVTVTNLDLHPMKDVYLDDSMTIARYPKTRIMDGSTNGMWSEILPGESESISYSVELSDSGVYSLNPALLEYIHNANEFNAYSQNMDVRVQRPSPISLGIHALTSTVSTASFYVDELTSGKGSLLTFGVFSIIIIILAFFEFFNLKKWFSGQ
jgi:hypothetical protein